MFPPKKQKEEIKFIFPADLMKVFPFYETYNGAYKRFKKMKEILGKEKHQFVTVNEFADYEGLPLETVLKQLAQ